MKVFYEISKIIIGAVLGAIIVIFFKFNNSSNSLIELSYTDLVSISLTAATVALGAVALVVTIAAIFGFQMIKTESICAMEGQLKKELPTMLACELRKMEKDGQLANAVERAIYSGGSTDDEPTTLVD